MVESSALSTLIRQWPVEHASAVVVSSAGIEATVGPTDQRFELASVTKLLSAFTCLVAIEEETIASDDPVPVELGAPEGATVAHLLAHASGLDPDRRETVAEVGTRRIYSNAGFEILGELVAARAGIAFDTYLREAVTGPLAMTATTLDGSPAHGAHSCVDDLARFAVELLEPTLVAPATLEMATTAFLPDLAGVLPGFGRQEPNPWGLGLEIRGDKHPHWTGSRNSARTFGHFGRAGTFLWVDPVAGLAAVVLTDRTFGPWAAEVWPTWSDTVLGSG
ncbi:MAG: serine hydrolase domain-containing protein [Actinomycetota bacterium]|nr:serine hydrolase domain-containing protein [Actinomycetota bacterium]